MSLFDDLRERITMTETDLKTQMAKVQAEVGALATMIGGGSGPTDPPPPGSMTMEKWLQLTANWTYSWPVNKPGATDSPMNLYLTAQNVPSDFLFVRNGGIVSKCPAKGVTTPNSDYPRAEFRQMINRDWDEAEFDSEDLNSLELDFAADLSHLFTRKRMCCLQFHGGGDDICQVIYQMGEGLILSYNDGDTIESIEPNYQNNQRCKVRLESSDNEVRVYFNGEQTNAFGAEFSSGYGKFGPYLQTGGRSRHVEPDGAYGEMTMWDMKLVATA
jgi:hypothetical protein